jgi:hypothetical protein
VSSKCFQLHYTCSDCWPSRPLALSIFFPLLLWRFPSSQFIVRPLHYQIWNNRTSNEESVETGLRCAVTTSKTTHARESYVPCPASRQKHDELSPSRSVPCATDFKNRLSNYTRTKRKIHLQACAMCYECESRSKVRQSLQFIEEENQGAHAVWSNVPSIWAKSHGCFEILTITISNFNFDNSIHLFTIAYSPRWTFGLPFRSFLITHTR